MKRIQLSVVMVVVLAVAGGLAFGQEGEREGGERKRDWQRRREAGKEGRGMRGGGMGEQAMGGIEAGLLQRLLDNERLVKELGLTQEQIKTFRDGLHEIQVQMVKLRSGMELAALEQAKLLTNDNIDEQALMAAVEKTGKARTEMAKLQMKQLLLVKSTFTKEQLSKVKELRRRHMDRMRKMREGGRGRRGGEGDRGRGGEEGMRRGGMDPERMREWREKMEKEGVGRDEMKKRFREKMKKERHNREKGGDRKHGGGDEGGEKKEEELF